MQEQEPDNGVTEKVIPEMFRRAGGEMCNGYRITCNICQYSYLVVSVPKYDTCYSCRKKAV